MKGVLGVALMGGALVAATATARAEMSEKEILRQCEMSLCELIVKKEAGANITCDLVKTWGAEDLKKGAEQGKMSWDWGDAQCRTRIDLDRTPLLSALNDEKFDLKLAPTPVNCTIGGGEKSEVSFTLAPTLNFEKGEVKAATLGIGQIEGSLMKRIALQTAQLVDKSKLLDGVLAKEINKFIQEKCPKNMAH